MAKDFWRQVRALAWEKSREHFAWAYPIVSGVAAFILAVVILGWDRAMSDFVTVLIGGAVAVITAVCIYCINIVRAGQQIHAESLSNISRIEKEKQEAEAEKHKAEAARHKVTSADWMDMSDRFKALNHCKCWVQYFKNSALGETWSVRGGGGTEQAEVEALCVRAGWMLLASPRTAALVSEAVRQERDPARRWLRQLKDSCSFTPMHYVTGGDENGNVTETMETGRLDHMTDMSSLLCIHFSSREL